MPTQEEFKERKYLINLHNSKAAPSPTFITDNKFKDGEIAIYNPPKVAAKKEGEEPTGGVKDTAIYVRNGNELAKFITEEAVDAKVNTGVGGAVTSFGGKKGQITIDAGPYTKGDGNVTFIMSNNMLTGRVSLGTAAAKDISASDKLDGAEGTLPTTQAVKGYVDDQITEVSNGKVSSVNGKINGAIAVSGDTKAPTVYLKLDNTGNVKFSETETGLKGQVEIEKVTLPNTIKTITLGEDLSGTITAGASADSVTLNAQIEAGKVGSTELAVNAVITEKIQNGAVTEEKLGTILATKPVLSSGYTNKIYSTIQQNETVESAIERLDGRGIDHESRISANETAISALSSATHFIGVRDVLPEGGKDGKKGDVVIVGDKEYIYNGEDGAYIKESWVELGDTTDEVRRIGVLEDKATNVENDLTNIKAEKFFTTFQVNGETGDSYVANKRSDTFVFEQAGSVDIAATSTGVKISATDTPTDTTVSGIQGVTPGGDGFQKTLDFTNMVIDCGEYV